MPISQAYREAQIYRFLRHDWRRYLQPGSPLKAYYEYIERKYRPDQARVPAGNSDGGQWTDEGGGSSSRGGGNGTSGSQGEPTAGSGRSDPRVLSDAMPDNYAKPGTRLAQNDGINAQVIARSIYDKIDSALLAPKGVDASASVQKLQYRLDDNGQYLGGVTVVNEDRTAVGRMIYAINDTPVHVSFETRIQTESGQSTASFGIRQSLPPGGSVTIPWKDFGVMQGPGTVTLIATNRGSLYTGVYVGARRLSATVSPR